MIKEAIEKLINRIDLTEDETRAAFGEIMTGNATATQISAFITALRMKGETVSEIIGAAKVMREKSLKLHVEGRLVDTCGTGGSNINTFNISTAAALVVAGCGLKVAKHGNRSASSQCGSADVVEALGVNLEIGPDMVERCIREVGIGFIYAPLFHAAMKYAIGPRREIGIRTIFNILGPLSNPAGATSQVLGVYDANLTEVMARVLKNLGTERAFVVHGMDGLDEMTVTAKTKVTELKDGKIKTYYISPVMFGLKKARLEDIEGRDAKENADIISSILKGERGPRREIVLLNASAALVAGFKARDFREGIALAEESIDSGKALDVLSKLVELTKR
ncbi:MAG: anthranilate phosphoribosyltransferase [Candidatus Omnitrophica bacterium]|nr:anthranilate phosphoribosyltransferase [Candidatus Omnitrophota bacterium]